MWNDVVDLRDFYNTRMGEVTRHLVRRKIRSIWPEVRGMSMLGLGYAVPFLRQFREEAERVIAVMPAQQGILPWPPEGPNCAALADETALPLPDVSVDRLLLVHGLECGEHTADMLKEMWRVLTGSGRILIVVPNRRGIWAQTDRTPFGQGHPYSASQLSKVLRANMFIPIQTQHALYVPPTRSLHHTVDRAGLGAHRRPLVPGPRRRDAGRGRQADLCRHGGKGEAGEVAGRRSVS